MSRWRIIILLLLLAAPILFLVVLGGYFLTTTSWAFYAWWPMAACMALAYFLGWYWQRNRQLLPPVDLTPSLHWTDRDKGAWKIVENRCKEAQTISSDKLSDFQFYVDTGYELALEMVRYYHPNAKDPYGSLTIPEILAVVELASGDLAKMVDANLPAGHLFTINDWRRAKQVSDWYTVGTNIYWLVSAIFSPLETGLRYAATQAGISKPFQLLQQNILLWFYTAYLHRLGNYLIELNSGRLRVGANRYRELKKLHLDAEGMPRQPAADGAAMPTVDEPPAVAPAAQVTITVLGQVKAGKSSLINAFLGEQRAQTDVLPATSEVTRYELQPEGVNSKLVLLDTVGYAHTGPTEDQLRVTEQTARQSDLLLLVLHARNPARKADLEMLQKLRAWFASKPELKMPPVMAVLTHIDLLSPAMEWQPPYDWQEPKRPKEKQMLQSYEAVREQLGSFLVGAAPVCTAPGKVYGIEEWLLPTVLELLQEARAVALLRCLRAEADTGKIRKVFHQLVTGGKLLAKALWTQMVEEPGQPMSRR